MSFADAYLDKQAWIKKSLIHDLPESGLHLVVVIPCYNEPDILYTLDNLANCIETRYPAEVIVLINSSEISGNRIIQQNRFTSKQIEDWKKHRQTSFLKFYPLLVENLPKKSAGVGLARKIGMDEAVRRLNTVNNEFGVIVSLDADCHTEINYLTEIESRFIENSKLNGANIYFEHPVMLNTDDQKYQSGILCYELYLRYYVDSLRYTNFPYAFHTIGSAFAVKANAYVKQGGMNRRQGGEDFYFLQKIFALGNFSEINSTTVYPSSRISDRVPFGTGPILNKIVQQNQALDSYHPGAFAEIKELIDRLPELYNDVHVRIDAFLNPLSSLHDFLKSKEFSEHITEIKRNTSDYDSFRKRFFQWFNSFMIIKYLNFSHQGYYKKQPISEVIRMRYTDNNFNELIDWLTFFRKKQRETEYSILQ